MPTLVVSGGSKVGSKRNKVVCFWYDDVVRDVTLFVLLFYCLNIFQLNNMVCTNKIQRSL